MFIAYLGIIPPAKKLKVRRKARPTAYNVFREVSNKIHFVDPISCYTKTAGSHQAEEASHVSHALQIAELLLTYPAEETVIVR